MLTALSGVFYCIILLIKTSISGRNLKHALGVHALDSSSHLVPNTEPHSICCSYMKKGSPYGLSVSYFIMCAATSRIPVNFIIIREGVFDKFFKLLGISSELQTGHTWFDKRYYIISETNDVAQRSILANEQFCKTIDALLAEGFDYVKYKEGVLKVGFNTFTDWRWFKPGVIERSANRLIELSNFIGTQKPPNSARKKSSVRKKRAPALPKCDIEGSIQFYIFPPKRSFKGRPGKWVQQRKLWLSSAAYVCLIGVISLITGLFPDPYPAVDFAIAIEKIATYGILYFALPAMLLHLLGAGLHLAGRARTHKELLWIVFFSGIGYSLIAITVLPILNGVFDNSATITHPSKLIDTDQSRGRTYQYYIVIQSWRNADTEKLQVSKSFYKLAVSRLNETVDITTKAGAFNIEWYSYRFASEVENKEK